MPRVLIHRERDACPSLAIDVAWRGFRELGYQVEFFALSALKSREVSLHLDTVVVGGWPLLREAWSQLGIEAPPSIQLLPGSLLKKGSDLLPRAFSAGENQVPERVRPLFQQAAHFDAFLGRRIWQTTLGEVRKQINADGEPVFIKPARLTKAFAGRVVRTPADLVPGCLLADDLEIWAAEVIAIRSEWRFFVLQQTLVGVAWQRGDVWGAVDIEVVKRAIDAFATQAPTAYGIDFALLKTGETIVIEVNDAFALEPLGLAPKVYAQMLISRWREQVTAKSAQNVRLRPFEPNDATAIIELFRDTVRRVNIRDYTDVQVHAWAPDDIEVEPWAGKLETRFTVVADHRGQVVGFGDIEADGHLDHLFVHADYQRLGIGRLLVEALASHAATLGVPRIFVEASITARPFFERLGFQVEAQQVVTCRGAEFTNYRMWKDAGG